MSRALRIAARSSLRYADHGRELAVAFFAPLATHTHAAMADLRDSDLSAAHLVFTALIDAMRRFQSPTFLGSTTDEVP